MDPLLCELDNESMGPCLKELYSGAFGHADDIRTIATSRDSLDQQISTAESFAKNNALELNAKKCEVVIVFTKKAPTDVPIIM